MTKINARLIAATQPTVEIPVATPEGVVAYCGRVSNPSNQDNPSFKKLFGYCMDNLHWSFFQMANAVVEIEAPRDITRQFTRHGSLFTIEVDGSFKEERGFNQDQGGIQEFSQRYSDEIEFTEREFRRQDTKNRQNSIDDLNDEYATKLAYDAQGLVNEVDEYYKGLVKYGVAKECARVILPEGLTMSRLYVNGTLRSWIHYLQVREGNGTQKEHVILANKIRKVLEPAFPTVFAMMKENKGES